MSTRLFRILSAICGLLGVIALMVSFAINPAPPAGATIPQIVVWGQQHQILILTGSWLQGVGSLLEVIFILALIHLCDATKRLTGWIVVFTASIIMSVSLVEVSFYLNAIAAGINGDRTMLAISLSLIKAIQHAYVIAPAPALLLTLGIILLNSSLLPRIFSYLAFILGITLAMLGLIGTFVPLQNIIDYVLSVQEIWFAAIAIVLIITAQKVANTSAVDNLTALAAQSE